MPRKAFLISVLIVVIVFAVLAVPAGASPIFYPTLAAWQAATSGAVTSMNFTSAAGSSEFTWYNTAGGLTLSGVNFVGYTGTPGTYSLKAYNPAYQSNWERGSGPSLGGGYSPGYLLAVLPAGGVTALAVDWATEVKGRNVTITLSTGEFYTILSPSDSTMKFFGLTSTTSITDIRFSAMNTSTMIDNFAYGSLPEESPESGSLVLAATGAAIVWLARRRLRHYT
jgi:hypothetical protein